MAARHRQLNALITAIADAIRNGSYTATAVDVQPITRCPHCGGVLSDDYLHDARSGRRVKLDDDEWR